MPDSESCFDKPRFTHTAGTGGKEPRSDEINKKWTLYVFNLENGKLTGGLTDILKYF